MIAIKTGFYYIFIFQR